MSWRGVAPVQLVILLVGSVMVSSALGIVTLAVIAAVTKGNVKIPQELATVCISSLTLLGGLLTPNTGLVSGTRTARHAAMAGQAAAAAVVEHEGLERLSREADDLRRDR